MNCMGIVGICSTNNFIIVVADFFRYWYKALPSFLLVKREFSRKARWA